MNNREPTDQQKAKAVEILSRMWINGRDFEIDATTSEGRIRIRVEKLRAARTDDAG